MVVQIAHDHVQQCPAGQREQDCQFHYWKAAAGLLPGGLRIFLLVGRRIGQLHRTAIHHLHRPPLQVRRGTGPLLRRQRGGRQHALQAFLRNPLPSLDVTRGPLVHLAPPVQAGLSLHLADDFAAGGPWLEHLPEKALASQSQGIEAVPAVRAFVGAGKEVDRNHVGQLRGQLCEGGLPEFLDGAPPQGGKTGAEGGEERWGHKAVFIPPY